MTLYTVLCMTPKGKNPWVEMISDKKCVADLYCKINHDNGIFCIVVEKLLNQLPQKRTKTEGNL
tara:strand:+ start:3210 stop:3401 length:192 start_codon:yes stop_codon:yes gene_type:complete